MSEGSVADIASAGHDNLPYKLDSFLDVLQVEFLGMKFQSERLFQYFLASLPEFYAEFFSWGNAGDIVHKLLNLCPGSLYIGLDLLYVVTHIKVGFLLARDVANGYPGVVLFSEQRFMRCEHIPKLGGAFADAVLLRSMPCRYLGQIKERVYIVPLVSFLNELFKEAP